MYVCGVTPYGPVHIGHARCYVVYDVIRRYLEHVGYTVLHVQNFTDIDDKIIAAANEEGIPAEALAERYIRDYFRDMDALGVKRAHLYPKVTQHIPEIIEVVRGLVERGMAYEVDGDVYLSVRKVPGYGKLSGRQLDELLAGARVEVDERKEDPLDFALWKAAKPGEPSWESPWGPGRPGWHIECTVMSRQYLGDGFEIHGGGADLIFPHHENEIAQAEAYTGGRDFVRYWLHNGYVNVRGEKMSKSLRNFWEVNEVLKRYDPDVLRLYLISVHYRHTIEFEPEHLDDAARGYERLLIALQNADARLRTPWYHGEEGGVEVAVELREEAQAAHRRFHEAMQDDFNTAQALAALYDLVTVLNRATDAAQFRPALALLQAIQQGRDTLLGLGRVLGLFQRYGVAAAEEDLTEPLVELLIEVRQKARAAKDWAMADAIRDRLKQWGIALEDTPEGTRWRRVVASNTLEASA
jgi:cysteinyl-tRNA synthetase